MNRIVCIVALAACMPMYLTAQKSVPKAEPVYPDVAVGLHLAGATPIIGQPSAMTFGPYSCDSKGNVFLGIYNGPDDPQSFIKVDKDGNIKGRFVPPADKDVEPGPRAVSDGEVYQLLRDSKKGQNFIVKYGDSGGIKTKVTIAEGFELQGSFSVFKSGEFLIAASNQPRGNATRVKPFTGVFDSNGNLLKRIDFEDDAKIVKALENHDESFVPTPNQRYNHNFAVIHGTAVPAPDGNVYVLRATIPAIVYVISPAGVVVRRFTVDSGELELLPRGLFQGDGELAVVFTRLATPNRDSVTRIKVINPATGDVTRSFDGGEHFKAGVVCFESPDMFTFLGIKDGKLALEHASP
jgi:hypothetical protein